MLGQVQPEPPRKRGTVPVDAGVEDVLSEFAPGGHRVDSQHLEGPPLVSRSPENSLSLPHAPRTILNIVDLGNEAIAPLFGVVLTQGARREASCARPTTLSFAPEFL